MGVIFVLSAAGKFSGRKLGKVNKSYRQLYKP